MPTQQKQFHWPSRTPFLTGYQLAGTTPGGIFLHGFRSHCDGEKSRGLSEHAANRGRFWLRYNQRHCAQSNNEFAHFTISQAIHDAIAVLDFFRQPVVLVGSSLGALIALQAAQQRAEWVSGLLLLAPAVRFVERYFLTLPEDDIKHWRDRGAKTFPDQYEEGTFTLNYSFFADAAAYRTLGPWKFDFPVAILHGQRDELLPVEDSIELKAMIQCPAISLDIIADGDHRLNAAIPSICQKLDTLWAKAGVPFEAR